MVHHRRGLRRYLRDDERAAALERGQADDARTRALLDYVEKLTLDPASCSRADVDALRAAGFGDADVLAVCEVAAYYAYANRIADGLGVELEAE